MAVQLLKELSLDKAMHDMKSPPGAALAAFESALIGRRDEEASCFLSLVHLNDSYHFLVIDAQMEKDT